MAAQDKGSARQAIRYLYKAGELASNGGDEPVTGLCDATYSLQMWTVVRGSLVIQRNLIELQVGLDQRV